MGSWLGCLAGELREEQQGRLRSFVAGQGTDLGLIDDFGGAAVRELVSQIRATAPLAERDGLRGCLLRYLQARSSEIDERSASAGRAAVYAGLASADAAERQRTVLTVAEVEGDRGLDRLRPLLRDPSEAVRIAVLTRYGACGGADRAGELETLIDERSRQQPADTAGQDETTVFAGQILQRLRLRLEQEALAAAEQGARAERQHAVQPEPVGLYNIDRVPAAASVAYLEKAVQVYGWDLPSARAARQAMKQVKDYPKYFSQRLAWARQGELIDYTAFDDLSSIATREAAAVVAPYLFDFGSTGRGDILGDVYALAAARSLQAMHLEGTPPMSGRPEEVRMNDLVTLQRWAVETGLVPVIYRPGIP